MSVQHVSRRGREGKHEPRTGRRSTAFRYRSCALPLETEGFKTS